MRFFKALLIAFFLLCIIEETQEWGIFRKIVKGVSKASKAVVKGVKTVVQGTKAVFKGCCGIYPSVCKHKAEFKNRQHDIARKQRYINSQWPGMKKQMAWLKSVNDNNALIYQNIRRITLKSERVVTILDPDIISKFNNVSTKLKIGIRSNNDTILKYGINQLEKEFEKVKAETDSSVKDLAVVDAAFAAHKGLAKMADDMFKLAEITQVTKLLSSNDGAKFRNARKEVKNMLAFHYSDKAAYSKRITVQIIVSTNFYQTYLNIARGVNIIISGFNGFINYIKDMATCKKQYNDINKAIVEIRVDHLKVNKVYRDLFAYKDALHKSVIRMKSEIVNIKLLKELVLIENIAKLTSSQSKSSVDATSKIREYRTKISSSVNELIPNLQAKLNSALSSISFTAECYERKLGIIESIYRSCKQGLGDLDELYKQAVINWRPNEAKCRDQSGFPYTTKASVTRLVHKKAAKELFEVNCLVNGVTKTLTCESKYEGYSNTDIAAKMKVNVATINELTESCRLHKLSPADIKTICDLKPHVSIPSLYNIFSRADREQLRHYYQRCA